MPLLVVVLLEVVDLFVAPVFVIEELDVFERDQGVTLGPQEQPGNPDTLDYLCDIQSLEQVFFCLQL